MAMLDPDLRSPLRTTLDSLREGAQVIDRQWRYAYINPAAARHGGSSVEALAGRTMMDAYPGIENSKMFAELRRSMETRVRTELENEFVGADGVNRCFHLVVEPVPEGLFILSLDVTDVKRAAKELEESHARFEAVIQSLHEGVIISDREGNLLHWNRAALAMLGLSGPIEDRDQRAAAASDFRLSTLDGEPLAPEQFPLARVLRGETILEEEVRVSAPGLPSERVISYSGATVNYGSDKSLAFLTLRDLTEHKELEQQFMHAQRMDSIGSLAAGVAHDLNNILMPILFGAAILRRVNASDPASRTIDNIERSAKRGSDLVKQILAFVRGSKNPSGTVALRQVLADIEAIVPSTFPKNVTLSIDVAADLEPVRGDVTQLFQVVLNLCVNARDAMPDGGRISISGRNMQVTDDLARGRGIGGGRYVVLDVADEGVGMPPEVMKRIFDPFFTTKAVGQGTGLGLVTVRDIVRRHDGFIDVSSEGGRGTLFRTFLPARTEEAASIGPETRDVPRGNGELLLVVDNEVSILTVTKEMLEAFGYHVLTADDGGAAIALYLKRSAEISLVVTDMLMHLVDGASVITAVLERNPEAHIIATSADSRADWMVRAAAAGARHFLAKPYAAPMILRMVADVLAQDSRERHAD